MVNKYRSLRLDNKGSSLILVIAVMLFLLTISSMTLVLANNLMHSVRQRHETLQTQAYMQSSEDIVSKLLKSEKFKTELDSAIANAAADKSVDVNEIVSYEFTIDGVKDSAGDPVGIVVNYNKEGKYKDNPLITITVQHGGEEYSFSNRYASLIK